MSIAVQVTLFAAAAVCGAAGTAAMRPLALRLGIVNHPNPIVPQHRHAVAYLGGVGIFLGIVVTVAGAVVAGWKGRYVGSPHTLIALSAGSALFLALGIADDLRAFSPALKFAMQICIASLAVILGLRFRFTGWVPLDSAASAFCILTLVNAFNLIDVCDGLLGSLSVVMFLGFGLIRPEMMVAATIVAGACAGFLVFNAPPARIFLGDAGSHLLGFLAAAFLLGAPGPASKMGLVQMLLIVGVPLFELSFLIVVRWRKGLKWWRGSPDHFALRLQAAGASRAQTDLIACTAAVLLVGLALAFPALGRSWQVAMLLGLAAAAALCARTLLRWEVAEPRSPRAGIVDAAAIP